MKKVCFLLVLLQAAWIAGAQSSGASTFYVAARTVDIKESSEFFAGKLGTLVFGEAVTVLQRGEKWYAIESGSGIRGWAPADAFSSRRLVRSGAEISVTEFPLAGKGFSGSPEGIAHSPGNAVYAEIDAMENRTIPPEALRAFLREGRLAEGN